MTFIVFLFLSNRLNAAVLKHDISAPRFSEYEYVEVCKEFGVQDAILITPRNLSEIECLNKTFKLMDFCLKKFPLDKSLTRGFIEKTKKKVVCERSDSVMISLSCDIKDLKYCLNPQKGCEELRKIFANRLDLAHFSMLEKNINCYFSKSIGDSFNEN